MVLADEVERTKKPLLPPLRAFLAFGEFEREPTRVFRNDTSEFFGR